MPGTAVAAPYPLLPPTFSLLGSAALPRVPAREGVPGAAEDLDVGDTVLDPEGRSDAIITPGDGGNLQLPRWVWGLKFDPEATQVVNLFQPSTGTTAANTAPTLQAAEQVLPVGFTVDDQASVFDFRSHRFDERLTRLMQAMTPKALGAEFWTGGTMGGPRLVDTSRLTAGTAPRTLTPAAGPAPGIATVCGDVTPASAPAAGCSPQRALVELERWLRNSGSGADGMIHAEPGLVTAWAQTEDIRQVGNRLFTLQGTIIVPDPGYPGTGPDGSGGPNTSTSWAYATDIVTAWVSPIMLVPGSDADVMPAISPGVNTLTYRATRVAGAGMDLARLFCVRAALPA